MVLLQFSWRIGSKDLMNQSGKDLFSKDFINALDILSISAMPLFSGPDSLFSVNNHP